MTRKISLITATVGAALVFAVPAWGSYGLGDGVDRAEAARQANMLDARERGLSHEYQLADVAATNQIVKTMDARKKALGRDFQLGDFAVNNEWQSTLATDPIAEMLDARKKALGRDFQLGDFAVNNEWQYALATTRDPVVDDRFRIDHSNVPAPVSVQSSGNEIEWPQIGIGFGVGILLALALFMGLRLVYTRPLAH